MSLLSPLLKYFSISDLVKYMSDDLSFSKKVSAFDPPLGEANPSRQRSREVVLPDDWLVRDFLVAMTKDVFSGLIPCFQIPNNEPIRKGHGGEKCYTEGSSDVGFYEATFIAGLRLPLTSLHRRLAAYIGVSVCQIASNAWRIFIEAKVLLGQLSGGHWSLTLDEFFHCYKLQEIPQSKGFYNFVCRQLP